MADHWRPAWADIDLDAVRHNAGVLRRLAAPAQVCAVVKADGYGHGALAVARAALEGGASWLAVALVEEGVALRQAGIDAPILLLSEPPVESMAEALAQRRGPDRLHHGPGSRRSPGWPPRPDGRRSTSISRSTPACTGSAPTGATRRPWPASSPPTRALQLGAVWTHLAVADGADGGRPRLHPAPTRPVRRRWWRPWPRPGTGPR